MKRILTWGLIALVVLLVAAVVAATIFLDKAIKAGVETYGSQFTQVSVRLDAVKLSLLSGGGSLEGFVVGNPKGYQSPESIRIGSASLSLKPGSLLSDKIVVRSLQMHGAEITFEGDLKRNNLDQILQNVQQATGGTTNQTAAPPAEEPSKKLQVDEFVLSGAKVNVSTPLLKGKPLTLRLPDIRLTALGTGPEGITAGDLSAQLLKALNTETLKAVGNSLTDVGRQVIDSAAESAVDKAGKAIEGGISDLLKKKKP